MANKVGERSVFSLVKLRTVGDPAADALVAPFLEIGKGKELIQALTQPNMPLPDYLKEKLDDKGLYEPLPVWADEKKLAQGLQFFQKHWQKMQMLLAVYSLPYCYLAADGVKVLYFSKQLKDNTFQRLVLTGDFVIRVMNWENIQNGIAQKTCLRARLLHAASRWFVLHSGRWDAAWGHPINQEDMLGTNLSFSLISIRGLRKLGTIVSPEEADAFIHLWNVIGYWMGVQEDILPESSASAWEIDRLIAQRQFKKSKEGAELAAALLNAIKNNVPKNQQTGIPQLMRFCLGEEYADYLEIPKQSETIPVVELLKMQYLFQDFIFPKAQKLPQPSTQFVW